MSHQGTQAVTQSIPDVYDWLIAPEICRLIATGRAVAALALNGEDRRFWVFPEEVNKDKRVTITLMMTKKTRAPLDVLSCPAVKCQCKTPMWRRLIEKSLQQLKARRVMVRRFVVVRIRRPRLQLPDS